VHTEKIQGKIEEFPYRNNFYFQKKDKKIVKILETFYFDNYGQFESRFRSLTKKIFFKHESTHACNYSPKKIYHKVVNNELRINCFSVGILENNEDIYGPNFGSVEHLSLSLRKNKIQKFLNKNNLEIPKKMIRTEHYFYKAGKIVWVFLTSNIDELNYEDELNKYILLSIVDHKDFEDNFRFKVLDKIDFVN
jgi:hypothetical protein